VAALVPRLAPGAAPAEPSLSPEAWAAADVFTSALGRGLDTALADCSSARELCSWGYGRDVDLAADYRASAVAPLLSGGEFRA
ncbi:MAG TPA: hypothetical protein VGD67_00730, partial [Pseudonocardiaceae bacterium]